MDLLSYHVYLSYLTQGGTDTATARFTEQAAHPLQALSLALERLGLEHDIAPVQVIMCTISLDKEC